MSDNVQPHEVDYKHGHCDAFAWAVHHITNWPIVKYAPSTFDNIHHWACEIPNEKWYDGVRHFDVDGPQDSENLRNYYQKILKHLENWEEEDPDPEFDYYPSDVHELENYNSDEEQGDYSTKNMGKWVVPYARQKLKEHGFNF